MKQHENYKELIWTLAKTDFKLRYHGSVLGYVWALLKPLLMFAILNFVFSSVFNPRNTGTQYFSIQLLTAILMFNFFAEGTVAGMLSFVGKSTLISKIYVPRWIIVFSSTLNSAMIFLMNLIVVLIFFAYYHFFPGFESILMFFVFAILTYALILIFSFTAAPLFLKFRDLGQIWDVALSAMFYATPIVYPLSILPAWSHKIILLNPMAFIVHFMKMSLTEKHFPSFGDTALFVAMMIAAALISWKIYRSLERRVAEYL